MPAKTLEEVLQEHTEELMAIPGVVAVAQGLLGNSPCVKVYVVKKTSQIQQQLPKKLHGHPVVIEQTGKIRALPKVQ